MSVILSNIGLRTYHRSISIHLWFSYHLYPAQQTRQHSNNMKCQNDCRERTELFRLSDYDCIGFDLDNTILRYNVSNIIKLEYDAMAKFLVEKRGYAAQFLQRPVEEIEMDFLQKGLVLDYENGNVLKLAADGSIIKASHGTKFMSEEDLEEKYGKERCSSLTLEFSQNILGMWNGPLSEKIRACLDVFDVPVSLVFARCVDSVDATASEKTPRVEKYDFFNDISDALTSMYSYENFGNNTGNFFNAIKANPNNFLHKCSSNVINWFREIKNDKITFLITGSSNDFASFTANYCLGENWQSLFDIVIFQARKPAFFTGSRPFLKFCEDESGGTELAGELKFGCSYAQGNWQVLYDLFKQKTSLSNPKCVYMGDNVVQDVYAVPKISCDAIAISEEMLGEEIEWVENYSKIISSKVWGSYFVNNETSSGLFWDDMIQKHASLCIPNLDVLANKPLDFQIQCFGCMSPDFSQPLGYFPKIPV